MAKTTQMKNNKMDDDQEGGKRKKGNKVARKTVKKGGGKAEKKARYFKLVDPKTLKSTGRYTGETPKQAASKGYTKYIQKLKARGKKAPTETIIYLRESTRGSNRKVYGYSASRQKLDEPQELDIEDKVNGGSKTIVYRFRNRIKKVPVPEQIGGARKKAKAKKAKSGSKKTAAKKPAKKTKKTTKKKGKTSKKK